MHSFGPLRRKLLFLILGIGVLPFLAATSQILLEFQEAERKNILAAETRIADSAVESINGFILRHFAALGTIGGLSGLFEINTEGSRALIEYTLFAGDEFSEISLVNSGGLEIARAHRTKAISENDLRERVDEDWFKAAQDNERYIGSIFWENNRPYFIIAQGIFTRRNEFLGAISAQVDARELQRVTRDLSVSERSETVYLVDDSGVVIAHPDYSRVAKRENFSSTGIVPSILSSSSGEAISGVFSDDDGKKILGTAKHVLFTAGTDGKSIDTGWNVIVETPSAVAFRSVKEVTLFSGALLVVVLLISVLTAIYFAGKIVSPVERLRIAVQSFRSGKVPIEVKTETNDEIGDLAVAFNELSKELRSSMDTIVEKQELIESDKRQLESIISSITDAIIVEDKTGKIIAFNRVAERLTGHTTPESMGRSTKDIFSVWSGIEHLMVHDQLLKNTRNGILFERANITILGKNDARIQANIVISNVTSENGDEIGHIIMLHDLSREQHMEKLKYDFISLLAHQFRTPLSAFKWRLAELIEGTYGVISGAQKNMIAELSRTNENLISLVGEILDVIHIEEGRFGFTRDEVSLEELLKETITGAKISADERSILLKYTPLKGQAPRFRVDIVRIKIVFQNLIENAIRYAKKGSEVVITLTHEGDSAHIRIKNHGIGISPESRKRIFEKFFRAPEAITIEPEGSGLGLYLSKNIVEMHGGKIWFESSTENGTEFNVVIPREQVGQ